MLTRIGRQKSDEIELEAKLRGLKLKMPKHLDDYDIDESIDKNVAEYAMKQYKERQAGS